jgi:hypothetical protein
MPDTPNGTVGQLELLIEIAKLQDKLIPLQKRVNSLIATRIPLLTQLRSSGMTPKVIHELTGIPLSTIYQHTNNLFEQTGRKEEGGG